MPFILLKVLNHVDKVFRLLDLIIVDLLVPPTHSVGVASALAVAVLVTVVVAVPLAVIMLVFVLVPVPAPFLRTSGGFLAPTPIPLLVTHQLEKEGGRERRRREKRERELYKRGEPDVPSAARTCISVLFSRFPCRFPFLTFSPSRQECAAEEVGEVGNIGLIIAAARAGLECRLKALRMGTRGRRPITLHLRCARQFKTRCSVPPSNTTTSTQARIINRNRSSSPRNHTHSMCNLNCNCSSNRNRSPNSR